MNLIKNAQITTEDINLAEKAFGPDIGAIRGKITRRATVPAFSSVVEIPAELLSIQEEVILSIDGLNVNSLKFLTSILHDIIYRTGQYIAEANAEDYVECMSEV